MEYKKVNDYEVIYMIRENGEEAKDLMFHKYQPLIQKIAAKYCDFAKKNGAELDDLVQEGMIALNRAIDYYQENCNVLFYTYASLCIERHLITYCRNLNSNKHQLLSQSLREEALEFVPDGDYLPEDVLFMMENEKLFVYYKNLFDFKYSNIFELRYNGFSYKEISLLLDIPISTIDGRLCKIRKILQERQKNFI